MAIERKMGAKALLDFSPGKQATTPLDSTVPKEVPARRTESVTASDSIEPTTEQGGPSLKGVVVYLAPAEAIALKVYAAQHSTSIQQLGTEAFSELFKKRGINGGVLTRVRANRKNGANR